jgi:hypothetical protein
MRPGHEKSYEIANRYRDGESVVVLSKAFNISPQRVYQIVSQEAAQNMRASLPASVLSSRTLKALLYNPVVPVEINKISPEWVVRHFDRFDLRGIRNLGEKGQKEVIAWVESHGLKIRDRKVVWSRLSR